jgi:NADPH-dependent curcumin reductase CurA
MNMQVRIARLPQGQPQESDFELVRGERPQPGPGQILVRTRWLSLDPYVRSLLSGRHFLRMPQPGDVMPAKAVAEVVESRHPVHAVGDQLVLETGLAEWAVSDGDAAWRLDPRHVPESTALGILGMPGMTAYFGLRETAKLRAGETVLVSAASGPVGSMVGQLARQWGARAIGIAGGAAKCDWVRRGAHFEACIDYKSEDVGARLRALAPDGVDVFFDNTFGELQRLVIEGRHLAMHGRVILCGAITQYNRTDPPPGPNLGPLMACRGRIEPIIVYDYESRRPEFFDAVLPLYAAGGLAYCEDVVAGLAGAPAQFCRLMRGENFGKTLVRID